MSKYVSTTWLYRRDVIYFSFRRKSITWYL